MCLPIKHFNTLKPRQNGRHIPEYIFKCIFNKMFEFRLRFLWKLFLRVQINPKKSSIGSDNGVAPARAQAIVWTVDGLFADA